jgi:ABC-type glycerol-3-phosphate transport system substrate-binding protein
VGVLLARCGSSATPAPQGQSPSALRGEIRCTHLPGTTEVEVFGKLTDQFQQGNPGMRVTVEPNFTWDLTAYIAAVAAGDAPDVVWGATGFTHMLYTRGGLQALDPYLVKDRHGPSSATWPRKRRSGCTRRAWSASAAPAAASVTYRRTRPLPG